MSKINHYDVLGVPRDCDQALIDLVYKSMVKVFHPDIFKGDKLFAQEKLKFINDAYAVIGNVGRRRSYDAELNRSDQSGANEEIYDDENSEEFSFYDIYLKEWKVICNYFPYVLEMYIYLKKINCHLAVAFQHELMATKKFRDATSIFEKSKKDFLLAKFGDYPSIHSLVLAAIETGNKRFALDLNRDVIILGEEEYPIILEKLGELYKEFAQEYYPKFNLGSINNGRYSLGLKPGRYMATNKKIFGVMPDYTAYIEIPGDFGARSYETVEKLIQSGWISREDVLTAKQVSSYK